MMCLLVGAQMMLCAGSTPLLRPDGRVTELSRIELVIRDAPLTGRRAMIARAGRYAWRP